MTTLGTPLTRHVLPAGQTRPAFAGLLEQIAFAAKILARELGRAALVGKLRLLYECAPLGFLEVGARDFAGDIPLILKVNSHDALGDEKDPFQALTGSVPDALS